MKTAKPNNRRNFLLAASLGTAGAAAGLTVARKPVEKAEGSTTDAQPSGYHASEHILKYYKTTEV